MDDFPVSDGADMVKCLGLQPLGLVMSLACCMAHALTATERTAATHGLAPSLVAMEN